MEFLSLFPPDTYNLPLLPLKGLGNRLGKALDSTDFFTLPFPMWKMIYKGREI